MFQCDKRCDGKFGNFVGTKHTPSKKILKVQKLTNNSVSEYAGTRRNMFQKLMFKREMRRIRNEFLPSCGFLLGF